jgi:hypothetical protein
VQPRHGCEEGLEHHADEEEDEEQRGAPAGDQPHLHADPALDPIAVHVVAPRAP